MLQKALKIPSPGPHGIMSNIEKLLECDLSVKTASKYGFIQIVFLLDVAVYCNDCLHIYQRRNE